MKEIDHNILRLALPSIVSNITVPLLGLCDVVIMGHVGGARHIGAIAVGSMIFNVMYWLFVFLRMSTSGLTAQAYGAGRWDITRRVRRRHLTMALCYGGAIIVLQKPLRLLTFWLLQAEGDVATLCTPYYYICIWGAPAVLGLYVVTGWLVGMQNTRLPMIIAIGQNVVNIATSLLLVLVFDLGIVGVAIGTLVAQWVGFFTAAALAERLRTNEAKKTSTTSETSINSEIGETSETDKNSGAFFLFLRTVCLVSVNMYFTSAGSAQGALILAANTLLMQFFTFYSYMTDGFANAGEALAGRYVGAKDTTMLKQTVRHLFLWGFAMALLFTAIYAIGGNTVLHLLTTDSEVIATASHYLPWAICIPFAGMAAFVWDGIFIGMTRAKGMLMACFVAAVVFFALWLWLSPTLHNDALWLAFLAFLATRGVVQTIEAL
ncbi:MAG: MATE family efflux transporter [Prevotella sp.]|nr:MATE family efflux transporter [Prevotella sp.]